MGLGLQLGFGASEHLMLCENFGHHPLIPIVEVPSFWIFHPKYKQCETIQNKTKSKYNSGLD